MPGIRVNREAVLNFDQFSTQGSLISRALGIAGFAFRKPGQGIVHGIKTLQRSAQPSTTIPALESIISPDGQEDNRPCTNREYQMLHTNYFLVSIPGIFHAK